MQQGRTRIAGMAQESCWVTTQSGIARIEIILAESLADLQEVKPRKIGSHYLPHARKCVA